MLLFARLPDACADVRLAPGFTSGMVLQRAVPARLAGWADVGERIMVSLGDRIVGETAGEGDLKPWTLNLPVLTAGSVPDIVVKGKNTIILTHLLAGDIWICSGQSNMEMTLQYGPWCRYGGVLNAEKEVEVADHPEIRLYTSLSNNPWMVCTPETAGSFSAIAYFFGRELEKNLKIPIGLIQASAGGTAAEYWTPREVREEWPGFAAALEKAKVTLNELEPDFEADQLALANWQKAAENAGVSGKPEPPKPEVLMNSAQMARFREAREVDKTGLLYKSRIQPLTLITIKGVIWYQGESNTLRAADYFVLMSQLIRGWRNDWNQGNFPFLIMQLVNFDYPEKDPQHGKGTWAALRAAQQSVADKVTNVGLAVGIDIGEANNIHPRNKQEAGRRLALLALKKVYGLDVVASGPEVINVLFGAGKVKLIFDPGGKNQRLMLRKANESGFELAGADGTFIPAAAEVHGDTLILATQAVWKSGAIRYAWSDNPAATLFNSAGLPAAPFQRIVREIQRNKEQP